MIIKILLVGFFMFALTRAVLRFRDGHINARELVTLCLFWIGASIVALWPTLTTTLANLLGVGRGADAVLYITVAALCYLQFRTYIRIRDTEQQLTELVRKLALRENAKPPVEPSVTER
jgi:small membrane protein